MKKLLITLFCVFCITSAVAQEAQSYEIDEIATANAPWKVGDKIIEDEKCGSIIEEFRCYREFLGITKSGQVLMQEFVINGEKFTSPFLIDSLDSVNTAYGSESFFDHIDGVHVVLYENGNKKTETYLKNSVAPGLTVQWYKNGQKMVEITARNGKADGIFTEWYENGQKQREGYYNDGKPINVWHKWDEDGRLIGEIDFTDPNK